MKCLIDTRCLQASTHYEKLGDAWDEESQEKVDQAKGRRLEAFIAVMKSCGYSPEPSKGDPDELRLPMLQNYQCLVLTSRINQFSQHELNDIPAFVSQGGSLLIMSNHPPFEAMDDVLARKLGFSYKSLSYPWHKGMGGVTTIKDDCLKEHPATKGLKKGIVFNNSCIISLKDKGFSTLALLPGESSPENIFAVAKDNLFGKKSGRVVAVADSGFVGESSTLFPGPGQWKMGDNAKFITQIFQWLAHRI